MLSVCLTSNGSISADSIAKYAAYPTLNSDPVTGKIYSFVIKVSTLQVLYSEAPFSVEIFMHHNFSMQFQAGIIFPLERDHFLEQFFQSGGKNASASPKGLISYRTSPYNSHGISLKYELRKYYGNSYIASQLMYKYSYYDNSVFDIYKDNIAVKQTESKNSSVGGLGVMFGRQTYFMKQATDWYIGVGIRARQVNAMVLKDQYQDAHSEIVYPNSLETKFSIYPFINFGFRTGLVF